MTNQATLKWTGCEGPDGLGCALLGCRCDCGYWGAGCGHPLTPDEVDRLRCPCNPDGRCTCFDDQFGPDSAVWAIGSDTCSCGFRP